MKIFGLGLSRTGTTSLTYALKEVEINIIHYPTKEQLFNLKNDGACDIPVIAHYKQLDKKFPNSKFIYTFREKEDWLNSMEKYLPRKKNFGLAEWQLNNRIAVYGQLEYDKTVFAKKYDEHDNDIRSYFKGREQDLLILDICGGEGTEKLFSFINVYNENASKIFADKNKVKVKK